ncbi:MAG: FAD:protein FMN transferase [Erysipelotrichaceae bacterium]|nr:FAD:protein FMN transferase [Erysipelotrichaceae bacterium]
MKKLIILIVFLFTFSACYAAPQYHKKNIFLEPVYDADGEMVLLLNSQIKLVTVEEDKMQEMTETAYEMISRYHKLLDAHHYYDDDGNIINNLKVINDSYGSEEAIEVDEDLIEALKESFILARLTRGYFNPSIGALSELWRPLFSNKRTVDPSAEDIEKAKACMIDPEALEEVIEIDEDNDTLIFHRVESCEGSVSIDLGAFVKGYVLDKAYEELKEYESSFLLDGGSSSIITYIADGQKIDWNIGVRKPDGDDALFAFEGNDIAVSTSGDDERFFLTEIDGKTLRRHHILDPFTGYSENYYRGITLIADDNAGVLDALSTALFNIEDIDEQQGIIKDISDHYHMDIRRCLILEKDGKLSLIVDKGFDALFLPEYEAMEINKMILD